MWVLLGMLVCGSVIELGGQDAKTIMFTTDEKTGVPSMKDKSRPDSLTCEGR